MSWVPETLIKGGRGGSQMNPGNGEGYEEDVPHMGTLWPQRWDRADCQASEVKKGNNAGARGGVGEPLSRRASDKERNKSCAAPENAHEGQVTRREGRGNCFDLYQKRDHSF